MDNKLVVFYKKLLDFLDYFVEEDGSIKDPIGNALVVSNGDRDIPIYVPIPEALANVMVRENGKMVQHHDIFNPLREMAIGGTSNSIKVLVPMVASKVASIVMEAIINSVEAVDGTGDFPKQTLMKVQLALSSIESSGKKDAVDDKTANNITKFFSALIRKRRNVVNIWPMKGTALNKSGYNRAVVMELSYMNILDTEEYKKLYLRKKDMEVLRVLTEMLFSDMDEDYSIIFGSVIDNATTFDAIMELIQRILKLAEFVPDMDIPKQVETYKRNRAKLLEFAKTIVSPAPTKTNKKKHTIERQPVNPQPANTTTTQPEQNTPTTTEQACNTTPQQPNTYPGQNPTGFGTPAYPNTFGSQQYPTTFGSPNPTYPQPTYPQNTYPQPTTFGGTYPTYTQTAYPQANTMVPPNQPPPTFGQPMSPTGFNTYPSGYGNYPSTQPYPNQPQPSQGGFVNSPFGRSNNTTGGGGFNSPFGRR